MNNDPTNPAGNKCRLCDCTKTQFIPESEESVHSGKLVCADCGAFVKWAGKPKTNTSDLGRWAVYSEEKWCFNFGKYNGQPIAEVMRERRGLKWCKWVVGNQTDFSEKCPALIDLLEEIAEEEGIDLYEL